MATVVYFKGEDFDEEEVDEVGSVAVVDGETGAVVADHGWQTRTYAKQLAQKLDLRLELDAMTDEELDAFKRANAGQP
jgi:hypothetical protein